MADKNSTFTGAMAIIKVEGVAIGKLQNVRVSESMQRARVGGLGTILPQEVPITQWSGTLQASAYLINWDKARFALSIRRDVQTIQEFEDYLILQENGVQIDIFKKITDVIDPITKLPKSTLYPFATITRAFTDSEGFNLAEAQVGGHDISFMYLDPIIYPK